MAADDWDNNWLRPGANVDTSLREQIRVQVQADYGQHTMLPGNKMPRPRRLPTGSLALDYISGGGYAFGHMSRFWGAFSSGKTLALFKAFISAQNFGELRYAQLMALADLSERAGELQMVKIFRDQAKREREYGSLACLFVNAETSIDLKHMERLGIDLKKLEIVSKSEIESIGDIVYKALPAYHVIGVDSTTSTMSIDEIVKVTGNTATEKTILDDTPATGMIRAKKWGINMDWWRSRLTPENIVLLTSHATQKIGAKQAMNASTPEHPPGGTKLFHEPGLILHFLKSSQLKRKPNGGLEEVGDDARGGVTASAFSKFQAAGGMVVVKCDKNKVGVQGRVALLHHDKRTGDFDELHEYEKFAAYYRVIEKKGSWWQLPGVDKKTQQIRSTLESDSDLRARIEATVLRCAEDASYESELLAGRGPGASLVEVAS
jgi:RecA/RadA recombinase